MNPTNASPTTEVWVLAIDERKGSLWHGRRVLRGRIHFDRVAAIENEWKEEEHHRPTALGGMTGHTYAAPRHEVETIRHRFAKEVAAWIGAQVEANSIEHLHVFAPSRILSDIRGHFARGRGPRIDGHEAELTRLEAGEIAVHPAVTALFASE
jgi:hypothetical protein